VALGVWALVGPESFSEFVNFPPHRHFVRDVGAFQLGIGVTLLLAAFRADGLVVALAGYLVGPAAHTVVHVLDPHLGGSVGQTLLIGLGALLAAVALAACWRTKHPDMGGPELSWSARGAVTSPDSTSRA